MQSVSVNDLARQVQRGPTEELRVAADRIRSWTREGLLSTVGEKNPGTGRSRQYDRKALVEAALLQALTDTIRISVGRLRPVFEEVKKHAVRAKKRSGGMVALSHSAEGWIIDSTSRAHISALVDKRPAESHTFIDLDILFERVLTIREDD